MAAHSLFGTLCIRADAGTQMGIGHVMRCLALGQAWQDRGGKMVFITKAEIPSLLERLAAEQIEVRHLQSEAASSAEAEETVAIMLAIGGPSDTAQPRWLALDGYHFTPAYRAALKGHGFNLLMLDDLADSDLSPADIILNQNAYASAEMYRHCGGHARLLTGSRFALLRREFLPWRDAPRVIPDKAENVLITLGGGDPDNVTQRVLELLSGFHDWRLRLTVLIGSANQHLESLKAAAPAGHEVLLLVNPPNLPELMSRADLAISAAGSSCWELACLGVPMLLIVTADNQRGVARKLEERGAAQLLFGAPASAGQFGAPASAGLISPRTEDPLRSAAPGADDDAENKLCTPLPAPDGLSRIHSLLNSRECRAAMSAKAREIIDGEGAGRVAEVLVTHPLTLRRATADDSRLLWTWVNDPAVRASAFVSDPISWEGHEQWFARRLADTDCSIWIGLDQSGAPIGQVRFERRDPGAPDATATVDVTIAPDHRGRGCAPKLLRLAVNQLFDEPRWQMVEAWIKPDNLASQQSFLRAGFHFFGEEKVRDCLAVGYRFQRP